MPSAEHACRKYRGREGRSGGGKEFYGCAVKVGLVPKGYSRTTPARVTNDSPCGSAGHWA
jgi:hypothetical protein